MDGAAVQHWTVSTGSVFHLGIVPAAGPGGLAAAVDARLSESCKALLASFERKRHRRSCCFRPASSRARPVTAYGSAVVNKKTRG